MTEVLSIKKLDETVINRIAAGEVIQRPSNALKEMLENSLDAKSTNIQITVKDGGIKFLQIQDNGTGIRKEDLEIVCERFTTSKLTKFDDLLSISTYGFRGEALASISHVAHLTIVTKTADSTVGYKACYEDSKLKGPPKPCAANQGTQITVEDLFYNVSTRRKALTNYSEEYSKIADVVSKYAVHNPKVGFTLKKLGDNKTDVKTNPNSTNLDNIRSIYGNSVAKELIGVDFEDLNLKFRLRGHVTNVNYSNKKLTFLLFINDRLVSSSALKKIIEQIYSAYLPKNSHPFLYLSINLDPKNVDVNVHPTKHEVHFLHEESILEKVKSAIENVLTSTNSSRVYYTQAKLPVISMTNVEVLKDSENNEKPVYAHQMVRTDATEQKLDKYFKIPRCETIKENATQNSGENTPLPQECNEEKPESTNQERRKRAVKLKSIFQLRSEVENKVHTGLRDIIKNCTFVGLVSSTQMLLQHSTKLYLCNTERLVEELFYQIMLYEFGNFGIIRFSSPISVKELVMLALETDECGWTEADGPKEELADSVSELLTEKSEMLEDYFSLTVTDGILHTIPLLLDKHSPDISRLPLYIVRIATEVDWNLEQPCLDGVCRETAKFYSHMTSYEEDSETMGSTSLNSSWRWTTEHVLLPALKATLLPPDVFAQDATILQIANLPDLYKVFERC